MLKKAVNKKNESGAALAVAIIVVAILSVIALTALAFSSSEARIAGSDLQRTQTFYATAASIEKLSNEFSDLFRTKMRPTAADLNTIASVQPPDLVAEGFSFNQILAEDTAKLSEMQSVQGLPVGVYPRVNIPDGPYAGLYATIVPYKISSTGTYTKTGVQVKLEREFNNYLVPLFQFGIFSNEDLEIAPGVQMTFNGRVHSNQNIFAMANVKFLSRLTMAGELVRDASSSGSSNTLSGKPNVFVQVNGFNVPIDKGSVEANGTTIGGPNFTTATPGTRGYFPGRPNGVANPNWETTSILSADGTAGRFGGRILTGSTGATQLKTPLQIGGNSPAELIKRSLASDDQILSTSRYHTKAQIRILIDDESAGTGTANEAGIPAGKGVLLSGFAPSPLDSGKALRRVDNSGNYIDTNDFDQERPAGCGAPVPATVVRRAKATIDASPDCTNFAPTGAGLQGRVYIEVVKPDGTTIDVTQTMLSMGITAGEPNGIFYFQRPLWAAFTQGSRDRAGNSLDLVNLTSNYRGGSEGQIDDPSANTDAILGFISINPSTISMTTREKSPSTWWNQIVPINVYNVREGWYRNDLDETAIYERGMTSVVDVNMRNLARWLDGIYDTNLLSGTNAVSANIKDQQEGFVVYISDRRGDKVKTEYLPTSAAYLSTNGTVDNEDIYGPNGALDEGEDVIDYGWNVGGTPKKGTLQKDTTELPDLGATWILTTPRNSRANTVMSWSNPNNYFRRAVRLFDAETLSFSAGTGKLSPTKGITIASENMVYTWGNINTTGITSIPAGGSTLNNGGYTGAQVPMSIVCDAIFPLSKTWFDGLSAMYPEGSASPRSAAGTGYRVADANLPGLAESTSVRAAVIIGSTKAAMTANPGRNASGLRKNGGINNFPRFLELWNSEGTVRPFNYTGSIIPLYYSTQALAQWENDTSVIYTPPQRNWSFDETFLNPNKLPPGTPFFQYLQGTSFRQSLQ